LPKEKEQTTRLPKEKEQTTRLSKEKEQTTRLPKEKGQRNKQRSTKNTHKTKDRVTRTPLKTWNELRCSGRIGSSCAASINLIIIIQY